VRKKTLVIDFIYYNVEMIILFFLGAFGNCKKRPLALSRVSDCPVCPCVGMEQLGFHWTDFHKILYLGIFRKSVEKFNNVRFLCSCVTNVIFNTNLLHNEKCAVLGYCAASSGNSGIF